MTEDIDDELKKLNIKEDTADCDSDVTPTNLSPLSNLLPVSSYSSGIFDRDILRYSSCDDYDLRSNSSLSWGEDEFEGEATRIVSSLFQQLDQIIYNEDYKSKSIYIPSTKYLKSQLQQASIKENKRKSISKKSKIKSKVIHTQKGLPESQNKFLFNDNSYIRDESLDSFNIPPPSESLLSECKEWVDNFPHFRIRGIGIDIKRLAYLESLAIEDIHESEHIEEEVIAKDGDYEDKLHFVSLKKDPPIKKEKKPPKGPPSRICSGSSDPDVLKEQILIKLFDSLWPTVTEVVEPLLNQYSRFLISHSVQYSSLSRESSTRGLRETPLLHSLSSSIIPPINLKGGSRPVSAISDVYKQSENVPMSNLNDELRNLLHISSKPLQDPSNKESSRSASATNIRSASMLTQAARLSLPSLNSRPLSSKSTNHLLTPRLKAEQRPASTSSSTRLRFTDKYNALNKNVAIEEDQTCEGIIEEVINISPPSWSRHSQLSVLPPIPDTRTNKSSIESSSNKALYARGKSLSAKVKTGKKILISPSEEAATTCGQVEPFVSWIVSKVEDNSSLPLPKPSLHNVDRVKPFPLDKTKQYQRASHH